MTNRVSFARLAALPLALAAAFPAFSAFAETLPSTALTDVVVTGSRVPTPLNEVLADVTVIDRATLDLSGQTSLRELLGQQPGVQFSTTGGYRSTTSLFLRGAGNSQTLILVDGVRVGSATSGGAALENLPLERIERIEILRGAASALYGPDAVGGVVQIFTREPGKGAPQFTANAGFGSAGQRQAGASVRGTSGIWGYSLGVSTERADGVSVTYNPLAFGYNPDTDSFTSRSLDAKLVARLSKEHALTFSLLDSHTEYQFDATPSPNPLSLTALTSDAVAKPNLRNVNLKWEAQWLPQWRSTLLVGNSRDDSVSDYYRASDHAFAGNGRFNTQRDQVTWQNDIAFDKDVLSFMLESRSESVDSSTAYTVGSRDIRSVLASYAFNRPQWNALVVVRNDDNSQFGSVNNWSLSGGYRITPSLRAIASAGTSFQAPSFNQLYFPGFGTPTLTPQRNRSNELGLKYDQDALSLSATAYRNDIEGFIVPSTNVQSALAKLQGVTLAASYQQGDTSYNASFDYTDARTLPNDLRLVRIARDVLNLRVTQRLGEFNVFGEFKLSSDREDNKVGATGRENLAGYGLLNLGLNWKLQPNLSLLARINNLNDAHYVLANGYTMPGRNAYVSLTWSN